MRPRLQTLLDPIGLILIQAGHLFKKFVKKDGSGEYLQFIVPRAMTPGVLYQMHNSISSGNLGSKKMKEKNLQRFYWFALKEDINLNIRRCDICIADKKPVKIPKAPMGLLLAGAPVDCIPRDYFGPFPVTDRGIDIYTY